MSDSSENCELLPSCELLSIKSTIFDVIENSFRPKAGEASSISRCDSDSCSTINSNSQSFPNLVCYEKLDFIRSEFQNKVDIYKSVIRFILKSQGISGDIIRKIIQNVEEIEKIYNQSGFFL